MTEILFIDPSQPDPALIATAAACVRKGGLVAFPTETVYGLGANAFDEQAVARIFAAKQRPGNDPIIVHIAEKDQLYEVAADVNIVTEKLVEKFWPGPLTIIQPRGARIPANVSSGLATVAVRFPSHPIAQALIRASGVPIAAPSANLFAHPSSTTAEHVLEDLAGRVDIIINGGPAIIGLESSVVDLISSPPRLLRPGGIAYEDLAALIPDLEIFQRYLDLDDKEASRAPGQLSRHYSPKAKLFIVAGQGVQGIDRIRNVVQDFLLQGKLVGILAPDEDAKYFQDMSIRIAFLGSRNSLNEIGSKLFLRLRELDSLGVEVILVGELELTGLGLAIRDRLLRAAEGRII